MIVDEAFSCHFFQIIVAQGYARTSYQHFTNKSNRQLLVKLIDNKLLVVKERTSYRHLFSMRQVGNV